MYNQTNLSNSRRLPSMNSKSHSSSSTTFKRQSSGHVPLLTTNSRSLSNITNLPKQSNPMNRINVNTNKRKVDEYDNNSFEYDVPTSNYASIRKPLPLVQTSTAKRVKPDQPAASKKKTLPDDGSLRIITSTVQGMKHWTNKQLPYPILFEIFGKLDSQVTMLPTTNTRQFSVVDDKDRVECIFAEMDQSFSNIDRDVELRIICRLERGSQVAHCIAIRVANKDEWHERRAMPEDKEAPVYTAEKILLKRIRKGKAEYYIKWKGWASRWNTWEPEKHILDKLLIADFNDRTRKQQKSKALVRNSATKRVATTRTTRATNSKRTRRLQSSSSSNDSTSVVPSPTTNDEDDLDQTNDDDSISKEKLTSKQSDVNKSQSDRKDSSNESDHDGEDEKELVENEKSTIDESIREFLWDTKNFSPQTRSITDITDQTGVTVCIREVDELSTSDNNNRGTRFSAHSNSCRTEKH
ncbi:unnamed protein product [Adineta ricciae]|nr:unnamed protein product [Adineta ricciae]